MKAATREIMPYYNQLYISIHAAREGGDPHTLIDCRAPRGFQSTPPVKAATDYKAINDAASMISIHAAREGGDTQAATAWRKPRLFQSTPPVKAATKIETEYKLPELISIHAAREGGDVPCYGNYNKQAISIHAAREGGDLRVRRFRRPQLQFQSTPPVKAATCKNGCLWGKSMISIHAAREGGDITYALMCGMVHHFNPRRP